MMIWVRSRNFGCLVTWFCYQLITKPGNKTATVSWPDPYVCNGSGNCLVPPDAKPLPELLLTKGVTIHRCIAIFCHQDTYRYSRPNVSRFTWNYMHRYFWKGLIKTHTFFWSDWWKYCDITQQSHVLVQPAAVVVVVTPSTGVAGFLHSAPDHRCPCFHATHDVPLACYCV